MAAITLLSGNTGGVTMPSGIGIKVRSWSGVESTAGVKAPPPFGSSRALSQPGERSFSGSLQGYLQYDASNTAPFSTSAESTGAITLTAFTGCTFACTALFTNISVQVDNRGLATVTADFEQHLDDLVVTWDQSGS